MRLVGLGEWWWGCHEVNGAGGAAVIRYWGWGWGWHEVVGVEVLGVGVA